MKITKPIARAADWLVKARLTGELVDHLPTDARPKDEEQGYAVQDVAHTLLSKAGLGPVVGMKIGCTTSVMQAYLGIPNPCAGGIFASTVEQGSGVFASPRRAPIGVECEIAVVLARSLPPRRSGYSRTLVESAVAACLCAIEVVENRYTDYRKLGAPTLIADDFFNSGAVLGVPRPKFRASALASVRARLLVNGVEVGTGVGADVMGDPLDALAWLATSCSQRGTTLRAREFILLGSVVQTQWVGQGDEVRIENDPLGTASARIGGRAPSLESTETSSAARTTP